MGTTVRTGTWCSMLTGISMSMGTTKSRGMVTWTGTLMPEAFTVTGVVRVCCTGISPRTRTVISSSRGMSVATGRLSRTCTSRCRESSSSPFRSTMASWSIFRTVRRSSRICSR